MRRAGWEEERVCLGSSQGNDGVAPGEPGAPDSPQAPLRGATNDYWAPHLSFCRIGALASLALFGVKCLLRR